MKKVELTRDPICMDAHTAELSRPDCGAVLVFLGLVRDHASGKSVEAIDYTCYDAMVEKELKVVVDQASEATGVKNIVVVHRVGKLFVGEASLGIVVASPHRVESFRCAEMIIDEIKKTVPIWKKEFGTDGSTWV